jgi:hypothetical protein
MKFSATTATFFIYDFLSEREREREREREPFPTPLLPLGENKFAPLPSSASYPLFSINGGNRAFSPQKRPTKSIQY